MKKRMIPFGPVIALLLTVAMLACRTTTTTPTSTPTTPASPSPASSSPAASTLKVVGHLNIAAGPGNITDVWALSTKDGRSYAYVGSFDEPFCSTEITGVHIIDISNAPDPRRAGFIPTPVGTHTSDVVAGRINTPSFSGDLLVFSIENCTDRQGPPEGSGILIYDITEPLTPKLLARNFLDFEVHNNFLYQQGERAFVLVVRDEAARDFYIVEVTNPAAPQVVSVRGRVDWFDPSRDQLALGVFPMPLLHDIWAQVYPANLPDATLAGKTIAYLSYWDAGLVIMDITDPANPVFLGDSDYLDPDPLSGQPPEGNSHSAVPTADGKLVFMGDEDFSPSRTVLSINDGSFAGRYPSLEARFTLDLETLPGETVKGPVTFVGQACSVENIPPPSGNLPAGEKHIALIERGVCPFDDKIANAAKAGYGGAIVFSQVETPEQLLSMSGDRAKGTIPALFVRRSTAFAMLGMAPTLPPDTPLPAIGIAGQHVTMQSVFDGWGYARILNVSNPAQIVEVGQFATPGVFAKPAPPGDHSIHNMIVEGKRAYISWYAEGIWVVDFSRPDKPIEVAHFVDSERGSNFWGVYLFKHPDGKTYILGSDRDTGLWLFDVP